MSTTPTFASASEAMAMVRAGLAYLAAAGPEEMTAQVQADYLRAQEQNDAISTGPAPGSWLRSPPAAAMSPTPTTARRPG